MSKLTKAISNFISPEHSTSFGLNIRGTHPEKTKKIIDHIYQKSDIHKKILTQMASQDSTISITTLKYNPNAKYSITGREHALKINTIPLNKIKDKKEAMTHIMEGISFWNESNQLNLAQIKQSKAM